MTDVLLDTTFLLPTLGFDVKEIRKSDYETLKSASQAGIRLSCSYISFVEILGKLAKDKPGSKVITRESVDEGLRSLLESKAYEWVHPSTEALTNAFKLRLKGHRDNIDNILYSIAQSMGALFLSFDSDLRRFLTKNELDEKIMITPTQLQELIRER